MHQSRFDCTKRSYFSSDKDYFPLLYLECQCALPDGMKGCKNLPAEMKIDYIRLYQVLFSAPRKRIIIYLCCFDKDREDPLHTIGCSPPGFPTKEFIEAHAG